MMRTSQQIFILRYSTVYIASPAYVTLPITIGKLTAVEIDLRRLQGAINAGPGWNWYTMQRPIGGSQVIVGLSKYAMAYIDHAYDKAN